MVAAKWVPATPARGCNVPGRAAANAPSDALDEYRLGTPQRPETIDPHLEQPERRHPSGRRSQPGSG